MTKTKESELARHRLYYQEHREQFLEYGKEWRKKHPDGKRAHDKSYYSTHRDEKQRKAREYRAKHIDEVRARNKIYRQKNHEKILEREREWRKAHPDRIANNNRSYFHPNGEYAYTKNKQCASYLGVFVAERALSIVFENVKRMPMCNPGYDFVCGKGFKVDVKSSCFRKQKYWGFHIDKNVIADYFLCIAFDDREHLTPIHMWLIPSNKVSHLDQIAIRQTTKGLAKWEPFEKPINKVLECCMKLRE